MTVDEDWADLRPKSEPGWPPPEVPEELEVVVGVYEAELAEIAPQVEAWKARFVGTRFENSRPQLEIERRFLVSPTVVESKVLSWGERYPEADEATLRHWATAHSWFESAAHQMHHIEMFAARLRHRFPGMVTQLDPPDDRDKGVWTLDVYYKDTLFWVISQKNAYFLGFDTTGGVEEYGYNPITPHHIYDSIESGLEFVETFLRYGPMPF